MSSLSFLKNFVLAGGHQTIENLTTAIVSRAPDLATDAELATMEQDLDQAGRLITRLQTELDREQREFDAINVQYSQKLSAAEVLQAQIDNPATSEEKRASLNVSLAKLLTSVEEMAPRRDEEANDVTDVKNLLAEAEAAYKDKTLALTNARANLNRAKNDLQSAKIKEERAEKRAEDASAVAGLRRNSHNGVNTAVQSMKNAADEARQRAAAANLKANSLTAARTATSDEDENVKAAMAQVTGTGTAKSAAERLVALKNR